MAQTHTMPIEHPELRHHFDDVELMLAMTNVGRMLAPGGVFLHNEARPLMPDVTSALGFPLEPAKFKGRKPVSDILLVRRGRP